MARLNIDYSIFSDPRYLRLSQIVGCHDKALGMLVRSWQLAQIYWFKHELIPFHAWDGSGFDETLMTCGLAERRADGIYVRGSKDCFDWYFEKTAKLKANASKGGIASAKSRMEKTGSAVPKNATNATNASEANRTETEADSSKPNPSSSSSSSSSKELNTNTNTAVVKPHARKQAKVFFKTLEDLKTGLGKDWLIEIAGIYPDDVYREREMRKAFLYYNANLRKLPTTLGGWKRVLTSWFDRGWAKFQVQVPGLSVPKPQDPFEELADKLLLAVKRFSAGADEISGFVGTDWAWISRSGLMPGIRAMRAGDHWARKQLVQDLRGAYDRLASGG